MIFGADEKGAFYLSAYLTAIGRIRILTAKEQAVWRRIRRLRAIAGWPFWAFRWAILDVLTLGRSNARRVGQLRYIRRFWRWYFEHRACSFFTTQDLGPSPKGRLILAVRTHFMDAPFLLQALDEPVVVPIFKTLAQFRLIHWLNAPNFYRQLKPISMDDLGTDAQYQNIVRLIHRGYSVLAFINPENADRRSTMQLAFETKVTTLIRQIEDVVLVDHTEFVSYPLAAPLFPVIVRVRITPLSEVVDPTGRPDSQIVQQIAGWYGFQSGGVIRRGQ